MGDKMAVIFAKALRDLPLITTLNLCDNALTDEGSSAIIDALIHLPNVTNLDLSMNKLDGKQRYSLVCISGKLLRIVDFIQTYISLGNAADALAAYLKSKKCPLKILTLSGADIDDTECDRFVTSLRYNTTIKELDMSNNKIGVSETLNVVKPEFRTGSEAFGAFLMIVDCPLESLKIQWNMIRLDGAVTFANALRFNNSLTYLDVSFNSLGKQGGEVLQRITLMRKLCISIINIFVLF